jgi:hypothetical protein
MLCGREARPPTGLFHFQPVFQLENVVGVVEGLGDAEAHWVDAGEHG